MPSQDELEAAKALLELKTTDLVVDQTNSDGSANATGTK
jgi:hypothetical protein